MAIGELLNSLLFFSSHSCKLQIELLCQIKTLIINREKDFIRSRLLQVLMHKAVSNYYNPGADKTHTRRS